MCATSKPELDLDLPSITWDHCGDAIRPDTPIQICFLECLEAFRTGIKGLLGSFSKIRPPKPRLPSPTPPNRPLLDISLPQIVFHVPSPALGPPVLGYALIRSQHAYKNTSVHQMYNKVSRANARRTSAVTPALCMKIANSHNCSQGSRATSEPVALWLPCVVAAAAGSFAECYCQSGLFCKLRIRIRIAQSLICCVNDDIQDLLL